MKNQKNLGLIYTFILFISFSFNEINAQTIYSVTGKVQSNDEALLGANVVLKHTGNNQQTLGTSTDVNGIYHIQVPKGNYSLEISYIGYTTYVSNVEVKGNVSLPPITLSEDSKLMNEIVVTARTVTYNTDGYVAEISKNPLYRNMDMTTVLKMSPGTYAKYDGVEVFGRRVSKIYLNGRELKIEGEQLIRYLETIDAKNVKQMEVITSSGVEEDAVNIGQSIIKITTFNPSTGGMVNSGISTVKGSDKSMHTMYTNVNWRINEKWGMYFNGNGSFGHTSTSNRTETHFYATDTRRISETDGESKQKGFIRTVLGISYDLDAKNLFSFEGMFNKNKFATPSSAIIRNLSGGIYTDIANGSVDATREYERYNLSFIYTHKFNKNAQIDFKADRMETRIDDNSLQRYEYIGSDHTGYDHWNKEKNLIHTARLDFTQKFKNLNGKLTAGAKATWLTNKSNTDYTTYLNGEQNSTTSYTDLYDYKENVYALYAKYALTYKRLSLDFGVRMEHTQVSPESSSNPERNYESDYTDFFPEVGLSYTFNQEKGHNINLGYSRNIIRPYMEYLNPLIRRISEYSYSTGNPLLDADYYHTLILTGVLFNKYTLNMYFQTTDDGVMALSENRDGILFSSYQKGKKDIYLVAALGIPVKIGKRLNVRLKFNYLYNKECFLDNENKHHSLSTGYSASLTLPKNYRIDHDLFYRPPVKTLYGKRTERPTCNISLNKVFPKQGWNLSLTVLDIFNSVNSKRMDTFRDDFYQISKGTGNNLSVILRVGYNFRWGKKSMVRRATSGNGEESGRVASE